ncbi:zinc finger protein 385D-like, partial [Scleropages formosus]
STCQSALLPALVRPAVATLLPSPGVKQFLPLAMDPAMAVNLLPSFSMGMVDLPATKPSPPLSEWKTRQVVKQLLMEPVQGVKNHTFGVTLPPKRKIIASCSLCQLRFNSQTQASAHYNGTKHAKKLKALEAPKCKSRHAMVAKATMNMTRPKRPWPSPGSVNAARTGNAERPGALAPSPQCKTGPNLAEGGEERPTSIPEPSAPQPEEETEEEKARRLLYCSLCKVAVNSPSQLEAHNCGTKHKTMLEARSGGGTIKSFPRPGVKVKASASTKTATGLQNKVFHCETCDVLVNSETQLKQHISSRRHKDRAAGKPPKAKYSPYSKAPKGQTVHPEKSGLKKELAQPLGACLLSSHLAAVAATGAATPSPFPLRPGPAALFHTQPLPPAALLRTSAGPIRPAPSPVLFAPY